MLSGRQDVWEGHVWVWGTDASGRSGWVPDDLCVTEGDKVVAASDYTAQELTVQVGQVVTGGAATHGWTFCRDHDGDTGWVPDACLAAMTQ